MTKFFKKPSKKHFLVIWGKFCPNFGKNEFSWKKGLCQFLNIPITYHGAKKSEKTDNPFLIKIPDCWWTDKQTDREQCFYRALCTTRVQKIKFGTECDSFWEGKIISKVNPFMKTMVHRPNIHYSKINQKGNWKKHTQFPLELQKNEASQASSSALHLEGWARYFRHRYSIKFFKN